MVEVDWSKLPVELLQLISEKLNSKFYQLRFRSVCSSWRSSSSITKNHLLNLPSKLPYPYESFADDDTFTYPISKRTIFLIIPTPNRQHQTLNPWLIKTSRDSRGRPTLWNPLSRDDQLHLRFLPPRHLDMNELSFFKLGHEFVIGDFPFEIYSIKKLVAYGNYHCSVLLTIHISGKLAIFQSGDQQWKIMSEMPPNPYTDLCVFNGRPIAVDSTGRTVAVRLDLSLDLVAEAVFGGDSKFLVESEGELLLVDKYRHCCEQTQLCPLGSMPEIESTLRFVVFKLDVNEKKWVKLTNLGDRVLFLGDDCAFSVKYSDLCMENGNCIIFMDDDYSSDLPSLGLAIHVFCLDKQQISPLSDLPGCSNLIWPPPQWTEMD